MLLSHSKELRDRDEPYSLVTDSEHIEFHFIVFQLPAENVLMRLTLRYSAAVSLRQETSQENSVYFFLFSFLHLKQLYNSNCLQQQKNQRITRIVFIVT